MSKAQLPWKSASLLANPEQLIGMQCRTFNGNKYIPILAVSISRSQLGMYVKVSDSMPQILLKFEDIEYFDDSDEAVMEMMKPVHEECEEVINILRRELEELGGKEADDKLALLHGWKKLPPKSESSKDDLPF